MDCRGGGRGGGVGCLLVSAHIFVTATFVKGINTLGKFETGQQQTGWKLLITHGKGACACGILTMFD